MQAGDEKALYEILSSAGFDHQAESVLLRHQIYYEVFVAIDEHGQVVGYLDGNFSSDYHERIAEHVPPPQAWGSTLAVAPGRRREGVGSALLYAFALAARAAGSTWFVAKVNESDDTHDRMAFFDACGLHPLIPGHEDDVVAGLLDDVIAACEKSTTG